MLFESQHLEILLRQYRFWRDVGIFILIFGVVAEALIDNLWEPTSGQKTKRFKTVAMLVMGVLFVGGGIGLEWLYGKWADDTSDQIRANLETELIDVMPRARLIIFGERRDRLVSALRIPAFTGQKVETRFCNSSINGQGVETDTMTMAFLLPLILQSAGWDAGFATKRENCVGAGIQVQVAPSAPKHVREAAAVLIKALKDVPLVIFPSADLTRDDGLPSDANSIVLSILQHPL